MKLSKDQEDALDAVEKINDKLYEKYKKNDNLDYLPILSVVIANHYFFIDISIPDDYNPQEIKLFNSENNDRIYYDSTDTHESFYKLLQRKYKELREEIYYVKF